MKRISFICLILCLIAITACNGQSTPQSQEKQDAMKSKVDDYALVELKTDLSSLSQNEKELLRIFLKIAQITDDIYWKQAYGNKMDMDTISSRWAREFAQINYGPWDRLNSDKPFVLGFDAKPAGACYYPKDMKDSEFKALKDESKNSPYTVLRRDKAGKLIVVPYHIEYKTEIDQICSLLDKSITIADNEGLKNYLVARKKALQTDDYFASDLAWMDMKQSRLDFVLGPIENYEDGIYGKKTAFESFILVKDEKWSRDLAKFIQLLPQMQRNLPCEAKYKKEKPGTDSDLNVYDVLYYSGDCNAGGKTIAINLPNDEKVQLKKGTRRLQLKNAMQAKFDKILVPIANELMDKEQLKKVNFTAFFSDVTFHEVAHGLGIKNTITKKGSVRSALGNQFSAWEEAKADVLGLYLVSSLIDKGEITNITEQEAYTTFFAGLIRSVRFGAGEAHGQANMMCFNYFEDKGAFAKGKDGRYVIDYDKFKEAIKGWSAFILKVEGDGNYALAKTYKEKHGVIRPELQKDLNHINSLNIPKDVRFAQGAQVLGL
jgi:Peptidase family M49.